MEVLGIDIGGSGIKGALVTTQSGQLTAERHRIPTPQPSTPAAVAETVAAIARHFSWDGPIGLTLPAPVRNGVVLAAANIDKAWIGTDAHKLFVKATGCDLTLWNDADAAGIAEMTFGAGRECAGVVVIVTLGTGIGTALFCEHRLVPNAELGHIEIDGRDAEFTAAAQVRKKSGLSWEQWARNVDRYLCRLEQYLYPQLIIIGGGVSKKSERFLPYLKTHCKVVPAELRNEAGIVGAALAHSQSLDR